MPSTPAIMITSLANDTSDLSFLSAKNLCLKSVMTHAEILFKLDEIVDWAAAKIAAINKPATPTGKLVTMKYGTTAEEIEEHTSELQSRFDLVCRLLLEKKKRLHYTRNTSHKRATAQP